MRGPAEPGTRLADDAPNCAANFDEKDVEGPTLAAGLLAVAFSVIVMPPLLASGDITGTFAAGFVNPYATGYSLDGIFCGIVLLIWVLMSATRWACAAAGLKSRSAFCQASPRLLLFI